MIVFRIAKENFINDLSGVGASLFGGRWNKKGIPVLYTANSRALATIEFLVHVPFSLFPNKLKICSIDFPDNIAIETLKASCLPKNWNSFPAPYELAEIGSLWLKQCSALILKVPSAVIEDEFNILINPAHNDIQQVKIIEIKDYFLDNRLLRKQ